MRNLLSILACFIAVSAIHAEEPALEFRLVVDPSVKGAVEEKFKAESLWLAPTSSFGSADVKTASPVLSFGEWTVFIHLTESATIRFKYYSRNYVGSRLAVRSRGKIIIAPVIQAGIEDGIIKLSADFAEADAKKLAETICGHDKTSQAK